MFCRAVALEAGHSPAEIDDMPFRDLELLAAYSNGRANKPQNWGTE